MRERLRGLNVGGLFILALKMCFTPGAVLKKKKKKKKKKNVFGKPFWQLLVSDLSSF